jgi:hypothetical protein
LATSAGVFVGVNVGANVGVGMIPGTKTELVGCSDGMTFSESGTLDDPSLRNPAKKSSVMAMAATPPPTISPMPMYFISERIMINILTVYQVFI